jgi:hypothetical protein
MELISFQDFGELRIRDFFPEGSQLFLDETGSTTCAIGYAATEGLAFTYFAWRANEPRKTAEIALDFREECPHEVGRRILDAIRLPLRPCAKINSELSSGEECSSTPAEWDV